TPFSVSVVSIRYVGIPPPRSSSVRAYTGGLVSVEDRRTEKEQRAECDPCDRRRRRGGVVRKRPQEIEDDTLAQHDDDGESAEPTQGVHEIGTRKLYGTRKRRTEAPALEEGDGNDHPEEREPREAGQDECQRQNRKRDV